MIGVRIKTADEIKELNMTELLGFVDADRREAVLRLKFEDGKRLSLAAGLLLAEVAKEKLGLSPEEIEIGRTEEGKPFIKGHEDFYFNLSHSGEMAVIAYGDEPVGIDVEKVRFRAGDEDVAKRFFTENELLYILNGRDYDEAAAERFFRVWTRKESYLKLLGYGLKKELKSFDVTEPETVPGYGYAEYMDGEYIVTVCASEKTIINSTKIIDFCDDME